MVTVYDVPANALIDKVAGKLKDTQEISPPAGLAYMKTGAHLERAPQNKDFWYVRCASLLRNIYIHGETGVARLRTHYGGRKNRGAKPERRIDAGGAIIRRALQQLEKAGFVEKGKTGRNISGKGKALLDSAAKEVKR
ncbi:MAG: 30S ribosomal protein S19e [Candidatus Micrarchaeota archaeon]